METELHLSASSEVVSQVEHAAQATSVPLIANGQRARR